MAEWPDYYGERRAAEADLRECLSMERLPIGLGALYVAPSHRSRGIGSGLVLRGMDLARALGHRTVYAVTARPGKIFTRAGWEDMGAMPHKGPSLALYRWQADEHSKADTD